MDSIDEPASSSGIDRMPSEGDQSNEPKSELERRMAMLERLEQLEKQREKDDEDDDEDGPGEIQVTTQVASLGLVKGVRLPDAIMLPSTLRTNGEED